MFDYNQMEYYSLFIIIIFFTALVSVSRFYLLNTRIINAYYL